LLFVESESLIPPPVLAVLAFWLMTMFASFSLFSPLNVTIVTCSVCLIDGVRNEA